jgi:hypothetical protein
MTLGLRKQRAEDRIEGREPPPDWSDNDYAVVDEKLVGGSCKMISSAVVSDGASASPKARRCHAGGNDSRADRAT